MQCARRDKFHGWGAVFDRPANPRLAQRQRRSGGGAQGAAGQGRDVFAAAVLVDQGPGNLVAVHREHVDEGNGNLSPMLASVKKRTLHSDLVYVCPKVEQGVQ